MSLLRWAAVPFFLLGKMKMETTNTRGVSIKEWWPSMCLKLQFSRIMMKRSFLSFWKTDFSSVLRHSCADTKGSKERLQTLALFIGSMEHLQGLRKEKLLITIWPVGIQQLRWDISDSMRLQFWLLEIPIPSLRGKLSRWKCFKNSRIRFLDEKKKPESDSRYTEHQRKVFATVLPSLIRKSLVRSKMWPTRATIPTPIM